MREIKNRLSAYLREVRRGAVIRITQHGDVVAELRRPDPNPSDSYEALVEAGKILPPANRYRAALITSPKKRPLRAGTATELLDADRGDA